jgi:hypothetical protein
MYLIYVGESNENRKTEIKIRNIAPLYTNRKQRERARNGVIPHHQNTRSSGRSHLQGR